MSGLPGIRQRAAAYAEHGTPGLHAPQDRARLLEAVEAVNKIADQMDRIANFHEAVLGQSDSMAISLHAHAGSIREAVSGALGEGS